MIDRWFAQVTEPQDYQRSDYVVLFLIVLAGAVIRFWGLGNVGLHGDEETMAMPTMAILESGQPLLPSGMFYARALLNIYAMAGSVWVFGESEWAFRFPSAIVGSVTALAAFFLGRRFLAPQFNLAFVASIAFLPSLIAASQTARMYVFFATCAIWFGACLFRWERERRLRDLLLVFIVWLFCLHFHRLAVFLAPLFLFPGLSRQSLRLLLQGLVALLASVFIFDTYSAWVVAQYPDYSVRPELPADFRSDESVETLISITNWLLSACLIAVSSLAIALLYKVVRVAGLRASGPLLLIVLGLLAMTLLHYHIGGILLAFGIMLWLRDPNLSRSWLWPPLLLAAVMAIVHLAILHQTGLYPGRKLIGALVGVPSVWPVLRFLVHSPMAGTIYGIVLLFAVARFAKGRRLPIHILFFAMAVWTPLLVIGYFDSYIPPRYAIGQLGFFLLCVFAGLAFTAKERGLLSAGRRLPLSAAVVLSLLVLAIVNPVALTRAVSPGYDLYPDHKGAANFIKSLESDSEVILIAEDVLQQTYYLGKVDYWLREIDNANKYTIVRDGRQVDYYTATPLLGTGSKLQNVLDSNIGKDVYILGSGENFIGGERLFRGRGIEDILRSKRLEVVFVGRDNKTKIWKLAR